jgi:large subunit ribosomal protein L10
MKRENKEEMIGALAIVFKEHQVGFLVDFRGMTVGAVTDLRRKLHGAKTGMRVLKNRMAKIASKGTPFEPLAPHMTGTRALVFGQDPVAPAKVMLKYAEDNEKFKLVTGVLVSRSGVGEVLDAKQIKVLGNLPPKEELIGKLLFLMKAPPTMFVRTLNEVPAKFVRTLAAVRDAKQKAG